MSSTVEGKTENKCNENDNFNELARMRVHIHDWLTTSMCKTEVFEVPLPTVKPTVMDSSTIEIEIDELCFFDDKPAFEISVAMEVHLQKSIALMSIGDHHKDLEGKIYTYPHKTGSLAHIQGIIIQQFAVHKSLRRQKWATNLLRLLIDEAKELKLAFVEIQSTVTAESVAFCKSFASTPTTQGGIRPRTPYCKSDYIWFNATAFFTPKDSK